MSQYLPGKYIDILDLETRKNRRIELAGCKLEKHDASLKANERVLISVEEAPASVSVFLTYYPECIRPEWLPARAASVDTLVAVVERCEEPTSLMRFSAVSP